MYINISGCCTDLQPVAAEHTQKGNHVGPINGCLSYPGIQNQYCMQERMEACGSSPEAALRSPVAALHVFAYILLSSTLALWLDHLIVHFKSATPLVLMRRRWSAAFQIPALVKRAFKRASAAEHAAVHKVSSTLWSSVLSSVPALLSMLRFTR